MIADSQEVQSVDSLELNALRMALARARRAAGQAGSARELERIREDEGDAVEEEIIDQSWEPPESMMRFIVMANESESDEDGENVS